MTRRWCVGTVSNLHYKMTHRRLRIISWENCGLMTQTATSAYSSRTIGCGTQLGCHQLMSTVFAPQVIMTATALRQVPQANQ